MDINPLIFLGIPVGLIFGFALQRGRFCMNSAFRDIILLKEFTLLKAVAVAIVVQLIGFAVMDILGIIQLNPKPFFWGANIVGGFLFGVGMVIAAGCASGITYRFGEGMIGAMSAVVGFSFGGIITAMGVLNPVAKYIQENTKVLAEDGTSLTLGKLLHIPHYVLAFVIAIIVILWLFYSYYKSKNNRDKKQEATSIIEKIFKKGWNWPIVGIVIGVIGMFAFYTSALAGRNYPLGITGGYVTTVKTLVTGQNALSWESFLVISAIIGAFIAAFIAKEFKLRAPQPKVIIQTFFGGFIMAFGAVVSSGCNIGHILSGVPQLSIGSIVGGTFIIIGGWTAAYLMFMRK